ncbi:MAG: ABC-2 transporter permease [Oscillospiraceae bacterium]|nr:ABC-2 transporter permease [Oscillospiraceae bacterium]
MKGLLMKDLQLMAGQKKTLIMIVIIGVIMSLSFESTAVIAYLTVFAGVMALGTLSYGEFDNGYTFLFTLPFSRKTYVLEKYVFVVIWALVFMVVGSVVSLILAAVRGLTADPAEIVVTAVMVLAMALLISAVMIPLRLKYGAEKSRIVLFIIYGLFAVALLGLARLPAFQALGENISGSVSSAGPALIAVPLVLAAALYAVSMLISIRILEKKEF